MDTTPIMIVGDPEPPHTDRAAATPVRHAPERRARRLAGFVLTTLLALSFAALPAGRSARASDADTLLIVIANAGSGFERLDARQVRKLFLGKSRQLPDGSRAVLASFDPATSRFNARALGRSDAQVTAAWSRLKFSGRVRPPRGFDSLEAIVAFVASTPNAIAYLPAGGDAEGIRTVYRVMP